VAFRVQITIDASGKHRSRNQPEEHETPKNKPVKDESPKEKPVEDESPKEKPSHHFEATYDKKPTIHTEVTKTTMYFTTTITISQDSHLRNHQCDPRVPSPDVFTVLSYNEPIVTMHVEQEVAA
jgi:hypothetical protein